MFGVREVLHARLEVLAISVHTSKSDLVPEKHFRLPKTAEKAGGPEKLSVYLEKAGAHVSVSKSTLYGWVYQRRIPFVKVGRALRFELAELQKFIQANRFRAQA